MKEYAIILGMIGVAGKTIIGITGIVFIIKNGPELIFEDPIYALLAIILSYLLMKDVSELLNKY